MSFTLSSLISNSQYIVLYPRNSSDLTSVEGVNGFVVVDTDHCVILGTFLSPVGGLGSQRSFTGQPRFCPTTRRRKYGVLKIIHHSPRPCRSQTSSALPYGPFHCQETRPLLLFQTNLHQSRGPLQKTPSSRRSRDFLSKPFRFSLPVPGLVLLVLPRIYGVATLPDPPHSCTPCPG